MPWKDATLMEELTRFVSLAASGRYTVTELCADFGVSRKTAYKHLRRYQAAGLKGLAARSHRTHHCPHGTSGEVVQRIVAERRRHRTWGPKKIHEILRCAHPEQPPPARSTIGAILQRHGLSQTRRRRPGLFHPRPSALTQPTQPNHVWTVDFKGWFLLRNGERCDALTVCDRFSRYLIGCQARPNQQFKSTLRVFKALLRHHGLPRIIRVDNGAPFASLGLGRLSQLSIWWIEHGITVEFTRPAHPQDNGSHERMHRDLKAEVAQPPSANLRAQQRRLERWQYRYNHERPHEAIHMQKPAELYHRSPRRLREHDNAVRYPATHLVKQISPRGHLHHEGHNYYVGEAFAGSRVGLLVTAVGHTELYFANVHLGNLTYDPAARFRPPASIGPPDQKPLAKPHHKSNN
jgi:transposase InsO family protein